MSDNSVNRIQQAVERGDLEAVVEGLDRWRQELGVDGVDFVSEYVRRLPDLIPLKETS